MDEGLIANWNSMIGPDDEVFHLGDVSWYGPETTARILKRLNGKKYLILGNHDRKGSMEGISKHIEQSKELWVWIKDYHEMEIKSERTGKKWHFNCFHFPLNSWHWAGRRQAIMCHGHVHSDKLQGDKTKRRFDVGLDANDCRPVPAEKIIEFAEATKFEAKEGEY